MGLKIQNSKLVISREPLNNLFSILLKMLHHSFWKTMKNVRNTIFQNRPNRRKLKSGISETVMATCVVSAKSILNSFRPIV